MQHRLENNNKIASYQTSTIPPHLKRWRANYFQGLRYINPINKNPKEIDLTFDRLLGFHNTKCNITIRTNWPPPRNPFLRKASDQCHMRASSTQSATIASWKATFATCGTISSCCRPEEHRCKMMTDQRDGGIGYLYFKSQEHVSHPLIYFSVEMITKKD